MKIVVEMKDVDDALIEFKQKLEAEGAKVNYDQANKDELLSSIQEEYDCGADETVYEVLQDLYDTIGLSIFNIVVDEDQA